MKIKNKRVLIIGASGVLGSHYVKRLLEEGVKLVALDLDNLNFHRIKKKFPKLKCLNCNVQDEQNIKNQIKAALKYLRGIDTLIYNAAATQESFLKFKKSFPKFENYPLDLWNLSLNVNLTGAFLAARETNNALKKSKGNIIFVSSIYGIVGPDHNIYKGEKFKSIPAYSASKAGIIGLTKWLASWNAGKVRVNVVSPGGVYNDHNKKFVKKYSTKTLIGRMAKKEEIFSIFQYLISDKSSYVTGQNFIVDGGYTSN